MNQMHLNEVPSTPTIQAGDAPRRLAAVERRNLFLSGGLAFLTACLLGLAFWSARTASRQRMEQAIFKTEIAKALIPRSSIECRELSIKDDAGRLRYRLGLSSQNQPEEIFYDGSGQPRIESHIRPDGTPSQELLDTTGKPALSSQISTQGTPDVVFTRRRPVQPVRIPKSLAR